MPSDAPRHGGYKPGVPMWLERKLKEVADGETDISDVISAWVNYAIMAERRISRSQVGEVLKVSRQRVQQLIEINDPRIGDAITRITADRHRQAKCYCHLSTCGVMMSVGKEARAQEIAQRVHDWAREDEGLAEASRVRNTLPDSSS